MLDPNNGIADIEHHEIRTVSNYTLYDDPSRIVRLIRFKARLGYTIAERTQSQYENAREAQLETKITADALGDELRNIGEDPNAGEILKALEDEKLLQLYLPSLTGSKLNLAGFSKLQKARQLVPFGIEFPVQNIGLFLSLLTEKLTPKERTTLIEAAALTKEDLKSWQKLEPDSRKLEKLLKSPSSKSHRRSTHYSRNRPASRFCSCSYAAASAWCRTAFATTCRSICRLRWRSPTATSPKPRPSNRAARSSKRRKRS